MSPGNSGLFTLIFSFRLFLLIRNNPLVSVQRITNQRSNWIDLIGGHDFGKSYLAKGITVIVRGDIEMKRDGTIGVAWVFHSVESKFV